MPPALTARAKSRAFIGGLAFFTVLGIVFLAVGASLVDNGTSEYSAAYPALCCSQIAPGGDSGGAVPDAPQCTRYASSDACPSVLAADLTPPAVPSREGVNAAEVSLVLTDAQVRDDVTYTLVLDAPFGVAVTGNVTVTAGSAVVVAHAPMAITLDADEGAIVPLDGEYCAVQADGTVEDRAIDRPPYRSVTVASDVSLSDLDLASGYGVRVAASAVVWDATPQGIMALRTTGRPLYGVRLRFEETTATSGYVAGVVLTVLGTLFSLPCGCVTALLLVSVLCGSES